MSKFGIIFGAMAPDILKQIRSQNLQVKIGAFKKFKHLQQYADFIVALSVAGYLSDSECSRVRKRLLKEISRHLVSRL